LGLRQGSRFSLGMFLYSSGWYAWIALTFLPIALARTKSVLHAKVRPIVRRQNTAGDVAPGRSGLNVDFISGRGKPQFGDSSEVSTFVSSGSIFAVEADTEPEGALSPYTVLLGELKTESSGIAEAKDLCDQRWGEGLVPHLLASEKTGSKGGISMHYYSMPRSGAPSAEGMNGMVKFVRGTPDSPRGESAEVGSGAGDLIGSLQPQMLRNQVEGIMGGVVSRWRQCPSSSADSKTGPVLFILDAIKDLDSCNVWHRMAAVYPIWLSRKVMSVELGQVDMLRTGGWGQCYGPESGLQVVSSNKLLTSEPSLCSYSSLVAPLQDGFLWDLAWDQHLSCGGALVAPRTFAREVEQSFGLQHEPVKADTPIRVCLASRKGAGHIVIGNEEQIGQTIGTCRFGSTQVKAEVFKFNSKTSFRDQVQSVDTCDVLIGGHGAALTHTLWLEPEAAVIEIIPESDNGTPKDFSYYRNLAKLTGQTYMGVTAQQQDDLLLADMKEVRAAIHAAILTVGSRGARRNLGSPVCAEQ